MGPSGALPKRRDQDGSRQKKKGQRLGAVRLNGDSYKEKRAENPPPAQVQKSLSPELSPSSPNGGLQALENRVAEQDGTRRLSREHEHRDTPLHKHFTALLDTGKEAYNAMRQATVELTMGIDSMVEEAVHWAAPVLASPKAATRSANLDSPETAAWGRGFEDDTDAAWEDTWEPRRRAGAQASGSSRKSSDDLFASWGLDWPIKAMSPKKAPSRSPLVRQNGSRDSSTSHQPGMQGDCDLERPRPKTPSSEDLLRDELKKCRADMESARRHCKRLVNENRSLKNEKQSSPEPDPLAEQVRGQLQALLSEKAKLAQENARLRREVEGLQELLDYTIHPPESSDEEYLGGCFDEGALPPRLLRTRSCESPFR